MKNEVKNGKLILGSFIFRINFNENPTLVIEEKINDNGTKQFTGKSKWNPFKFIVVGENNIEGKYELFDSAFIIPNDNTNIWKLHKCQINLNFNEINFERCEHIN
jgi:hypothetical protein